MEQHCAQCEKKFELLKEALFCPYCGSRLGSGNTPAMPLSIQITGDNRRAVQEKYWRQTRYECASYISSLRDEFIPVNRGEKEFNLNFKHIHDKARRSKSVAELYGILNNTIGNIISFGENADGITRIVDIDEVSTKVHDSCLKLLRLIVSDEMPADLPALHYQASVDSFDKEVKTWQKTEIDSLIALLKVTYQKFKMIVDDNGMYAAFAGQDRKEDKDQSEWKSNPGIKRMYEEISRKAETEYDPLFGEGFGELIDAFWGSLELVVFVINDQYNITEIQKDNEDRIEAIGHLLDDWSDLIDIELDKTYSNPQTNMIVIYQEVSELQKVDDVAIDETHD